MHSNMFFYCVAGDNVGIRYELVKVNIFDLPLDDRPPDDVIVQVLLQHNAMVYLAARSKQKAEATIASLALELSSLTSVKNAAAQFRSKEQELHIIFNNA